MGSKSLAGVVVFAITAAVTWSLNTMVASALLGGRSDFVTWREQNARTYFLIWAAEVLAIGVPVIWVVAKRMSQAAADRDAAVLKARGMGRLAGAALQGGEKARRKLVRLLDDPVPVVRYESARALVLVDDEALNKELLRKVKYWTGDQKLALIAILKKMRDVRTRKLLTLLAADRNPRTARRAKEGLALLPAESARGEERGKTTKKPKPPTTSSGSEGTPPTPGQAPRQGAAPDTS